jgi:hypothetical protein
MAPTEVEAHMEACVDRHLAAEVPALRGPGLPIALQVLVTLLQASIRSDHAAAGAWLADPIALWPRDRSLRACHTRRLPTGIGTPSGRLTVRLDRPWQRDPPRPPSTILAVPSATAHGGVATDGAGVIGVLAGAGVAGASDGAWAGGWDWAGAGARGLGRTGTIHGMTHGGVTVILPPTSTRTHSELSRLGCALEQNVINQSRSAEKRGDCDQHPSRNVWNGIEGVRVYDLEVIEAYQLLPGKFLTSSGG